MSDLFRYCPWTVRFVGHSLIFLWCGSPFGDLALSWGPPFFGRLGHFRPKIVVLQITSVHSDSIQGHLPVSHLRVLSRAPTTRGNSGDSYLGFSLSFLRDCLWFRHQRLLWLPRTWRWQQDISCVVPTAPCLTSCRHITLSFHDQFQLNLLNYNQNRKKLPSSDFELVWLELTFTMTAKWAWSADLNTLFTLGSSTNLFLPKE